MRNVSLNLDPAFSDTKQRFQHNPTNHQLLGFHHTTAAGILEVLQLIYFRNNISKGQKKTVPLQARQIYTRQGSCLISCQTFFVLSFF